MSNHFDPWSQPLNIQTIHEIDNLDLPIMKKHHVRILAHCLQILKLITKDRSFKYQNKNRLREFLLHNSELSSTFMIFKIWRQCASILT